MADTTVAAVPVAGAADSSAAAAQGSTQAGTLQALYGIGARLREYGVSTFSQRKPWSEVLEAGSFARPANLAEATARLRKNAAYFRVNYVMTLLVAVALGFALNPSSLFVLGALMVGWTYVFAIRTGPLAINGRELSEREKLMYMSGGSLVVVFFLTNVASIVFSALMFGAGMVAVHGATRVPDDLFIDEGEANQGLLSILTGGAQPTGVSSV
ncbi:MAG: prenylated rab acceptor family protein [Monoraphidium minutum]|nr:MAG: prenylated rab acceptor family protein [Monoraphidium minutum]